MGPDLLGVQQGEGVLLMVLPHLVLGSKENATLSFGFGFKMFKIFAKLFSQFEFH